VNWDNKVIWYEGMFLRAQHFQQYDRYVEKLVRGRTEGIRANSWGFVDLQINRELLAIGKFGVTFCRGILEDGTPFSIPDDVDHPPPLDLPENTRNCIIYLALPARKPGGHDVAANGAETTARYCTARYQVMDTVSPTRREHEIQIGKMRLQYLLETSERRGYVCLGVARVAELRADKTVILDEGYIAPALNCHCQPPLANFLAELEGLLHHRGAALAARVAAPGAKGTAEIADFLLLQTVNRYEPGLARYRADAARIHPETFYDRCLEIAGELATFTTRMKRPPQFPAYCHDDLQASFAPVILQLRQALSAVLEQNAVPIALQERGYGVRVAVVRDRTLFHNASFVLVVKADMPAERLRRAFSQLTKMGPAEQIATLVNSALPGIAIQPLAVAPRQLPFRAGAAYFELDRSAALWKQMQKPGGSGGLALFVPQGFPGLEVDLWALRS
jgi:type VI secretion system protein ImpJ